MIDFNRVGDEKDKRVKLIIDPQGPLSIIGKCYGSYQLSEVVPSKNKIYGMIENIIGMHFGPILRKKVKKDLKSKNINPTHSKGFLPLTDEFFDILKISEFSSDSYDKFSDFVSIYLRRKNEKSHFNGVRNVDINFAHSVRKDYTKEVKKTPNIMDYFPYYYSGTVNREYIISDEKIEVEILTNTYFLNILDDNIGSGVSAYLGSSESVVNVYILK